jgi:hypothetical protein
MKQSATSDARDPKRPWPFARAPGRSDQQKRAPWGRLRSPPLLVTPHNFLALGVAHFFARHFEQAKAMLLRSLQEEPNWVPTHRFLAACCAQMGRFDEAHEMVRRLRAITPVVLPDATHWRNPEYRELYLSGLRLAAGEAT